MGRKVYTNSFAGGEQSPLMLGHIEDEGYRTGFARGRNMLVLPTGSAQKRPQFDFVRAAKPTIATIRMFPFVYGDGDAYAMEWGPAHVRFHAEGTTLLYATPITVASVDLVNDTFTTVSPHGLVIDDAIRITHKGTSIPGSLSTGVAYYVHTVVSTTVFKVKAAPGAGAAIDLTVNSAIDETSFWRQAQLPREYVTSKNVSGVNAGVDSVNVTAHSLVAGDGVFFASSITFTADNATNICTSVGHGITNQPLVTFSSSGTLPGGLVAGTTYRAQFATANTFIVETEGGAPVDILTNGTGTHTATFISIMEKPFAPDPPPVVAGTVYYVSIVDVDNFKLHNSKSDAIAGTNIIDFDNAAGGIQRCHFAYYRGDIVWGGQLTILGTTSSRLFWCTTDLTTQVPTTAEWYQMPADGVYEIFHGFGADGITSLNYDQSLDVWIICTTQFRSYTLGRESVSFPSGSSATANVIKFVFRLVDPSPGPPAPTWDSPTTVFGEYFDISIPASPSQTFAVGGATNQTLIPGDVVYVEGTLGAANAMTGIAGTPGFFVVTTVATNTFKIRNVLGGAEAQNSVGSSQNGALRVVGSSSRLTESYVVTALRDGEESLASAVLTLTNNLEVAGSSNVLRWDPVAQAQRYRVYKLIDGAYGLVIETDLLTATDDGVGPDLELQPPSYDNSLLTEFPRAVAYFQQRAWFGGPDAHPRRVWGGKTGTISTMSYHEHTLLDTDRIRFDVAARERTLVRHIVSASQLWLLTSAAEIKLTGKNTDVLSPVIGIDSRPLSQVGCTGVRPIVANSNILFVSSRNGHVYELPSQTMQEVDPPDLSIRAAQMFDGLTMVQSAQQHSPVPIEWYIRSDGALLGMTYMPEQNIRGWHQHNAAGTNAVIESACVIPDSDGQRLYACIARTINGSTVRHIERMGRIAQPSTLTACKYLDSCVTYSGVATAVFAVPHLPGQVVYAVVDGVQKGPFTVANGIITLDTAVTAASTVHIGLLFPNSLRTLPPAMMVEGFGKGVQLTVKEATLRVDQSCGFTMAVYSDDDIALGITRTPWPASGIGDTALRSKDVPVPVESSYGRTAQIEISQLSPFPLTIVSVTLDVETGGP